MEAPKSWISRVSVIVAVVILIDQVTKIIVLNTMNLGDSIPILGNWLKFTFTENPGMAFGLQFGPPAMITIFSIVATILIVIYLFSIGSVYGPYRYSLSFVLGGALGNIIDRVFYGLILYDEPLFLGKVVDFIHVNAWRGYVPEGIPFIGGNYMALFPIWNVADMAIVCGVVGILFFQRKFHLITEAAEKSQNEPDLAADISPGESHSGAENSGQ
ncbi:MAG TPA: peptidase A8 [Bacteroidetes bacterium]|nr:peptidase A8 [Bacteroidota bacterium]